MNPRNTLILLALAVAFGAYVYFVEVGGEATRLDAEAKTKQLFPDIEAESVDWIELATSRGEVRLERRDERWWIVSPVEFPAEAVAADGLAASLADLARDAEIEDPGPDAEYGLAERARVVRFGAGDATQELRLGRETPIGPNSYAKVAGREAILTVPTFAATSLAKSLDDLREKRILDFDMGAVERLEARWPGGEVAVKKHAPEGDAGETNWLVTSPLETRADFETVRDLLSALSFLRADGFVDAPTDAQLASVDSPAFDVTLHIAGEEGAEPRTLQLAVGGVHEGDTRLVRAAEASLYTIPAERMAEFPRRVVEYRFRRLADFEIDDAHQLDLYFQPAAGDPVALSATRGDAGWSSAPEKTAPGKLARLVSELSNLDADDILADDAEAVDLAALELAPPNAILTVLGTSSEVEQPEEGEDAQRETAPRLAEIHLGRIEGSEWVVARAAGDSAVYRLEYERAEHIPVSLDAFRSRFAAEEEPALEPDPEVLTPSDESP